MNLIKKFKELKKETIYNYKYSFFNKDEKGNLMVNEEFNSKYKDNRAGYDNFREDYQCQVGYAEELSLRPILKTDDDEIKNLIILEEKLSYETYTERANKIEKEAKKEFIDIIKAKDLDMLDIFLSDKILIDYHITTDNLLNNIKTYLNLIEQYKKDKDFKKYIDKIIS